MKISKVTNTLTNIKDLKPGECFISPDSLYVKMVIENPNEYCYTNVCYVGLEDGKFYVSSQDQKVNTVEVEAKWSYADVQENCNRN